MRVIGVAGQAASGKNVLSDYLEIKLTKNTDIWKSASFASSVKKCFCDYFNVDAAFIEKWKRNDTAPEGFNLPIRKCLQLIGDGFRQIQPNIWIDKCFCFNKPPFTINDERYINEAKEVCKRGGINILLWRPGYENNDPNPSESQIKPFVDACIKTDKEGEIASWNADLPQELQFFHLFIRNDGDKELLYKKADNLIIPYVQKVFGNVNR